MEMTFYNHKGEPICYSEGDNILYLFDGKHAGCIESNTVFSFAGHHVGWFEDGWVRDLRGRRVFYTKNAKQSGPVTPPVHPKPEKAAKKSVNSKKIRHVPVAKTTISSSWSELSGTMFFYQ
jgi:hypothetical protein